MRSLFVAGAIVFASATFTSGAQAAVEYKLSGFDAAAGQFSFDFASPTFLTADRAFVVDLTGSKTNCMIAGAATCQSVQFFDNGLRGNNVTIASVNGTSYTLPFRNLTFTNTAPTRRCWAGRRAR